MSVGSPLFLWLPALAVVAHLIEVFVNALFHLWATVSRRVYSPGVITGTLLYLPLSVLGYQLLVANGKVAPLTTFQAVAIAIGFHIWSAWNHKRRTAASQAN